MKTDSFSLKCALSSLVAADTFPQWILCFRDIYWWSEANDESDRSESFMEFWAAAAAESLKTFTAIFMHSVDF